MFSDIEGSTALADRLGDKRLMEVLRERNTIIREQVKAHGGFEVKSEGASNEAVPVIVIVAPAAA